MNEEFQPTPSQTVGPFFGIGLSHPGDNLLVPQGNEDAVLVWGYVFDGNGDPVIDAHIEIWQPGPDGIISKAQGSIKRDGFTFTGYGRTATDETGRYWFSTLKPGATESQRSAGGQGFISVGVYARGLLDRLMTRIYMPNQTLESSGLSDSLDERQLANMVAKLEKDGSLRFDIHLQGDRETVFLNLGHR